MVHPGHVPRVKPRPGGLLDKERLRAEQARWRFNGAMKRSGSDVRLRPFEGAIWHDLSRLRFWRRHVETVTRGYERQARGAG